MINLKKMFNISPRFFRILGGQTANEHASYVRNKKKDHKGQPFKAYTPAYEKRKKARKAAKNQISSLPTPNLTLTGKMLNSIRLIRAGRSGFVYGITDPKEAAKMEGHQTGVFGKNTNKRKKRIISSSEKNGNAVPPEIGEMIMDEIGKQVVRQITTELKKNGMGFKVYTI